MPTSSREDFVNGLLTGGSTLARIGATTAFGEEEQHYFSEAIEEIERLEDVERKIRLRVVDLKHDIS